MCIPESGQNELSSRMHLEPILFEVSYYVNTEIMWLEIAGPHEEEYQSRPDAKVIKTLVRYQVKKKSR